MPEKIDMLELHGVCDEDDMAEFRWAIQYLLDGKPPCTHTWMMDDEPSKEFWESIDAQYREGMGVKTAFVPLAAIANEIITQDCVRHITFINGSILRIMEDPDDTQS